METNDRRTGTAFGAELEIERGYLDLERRSV